MSNNRTDDEKLKNTPSAGGKKRRRRNRLSHCPLFIMVCLTAIAMMVYGLVMAGKGEYEWNLTWDHPVFAAVLADERPAPVVKEEPEIKEEPETQIAEAESEAVDVMADTAGEAEEEFSEEEIEPESEEEPIISDEEYLAMWGEIPYEVEGGGAIKYITWDTGEPRSKCYTNPGVRPLTSEYPFVKVENPDYYTNALFIGDSRIGGLGTYSGWDKAFFAYKNGLSVNNLMEANLNVINGMNATLPELLQVGPYSRIFIMLGINEIGMNTSDYAQKFGEHLAVIREYQPDTDIIILGNTYVTKREDQSSNVSNNANINAKNCAIAAFANGEDIFYIDVNPALVDEEGYMREEISRDGVHILAQYYYLWVDYMNEFGMPHDGDTSYIAVDEPEEDTGDDSAGGEDTVETDEQ